MLTTEIGGYADGFTTWGRADIPSQMGPGGWVGLFVASVNAPSIQCLVLKPVETEKPCFA